MKNAYAAKLQAKKHIEQTMTAKEAVRRTTDLLQDVFTIALNREGYGAKRIHRVNGYINETLAEYAALIEEGDVEYASDTLKKRAAAIMQSLQEGETE